MPVHRAGPAAVARGDRRDVDDVAATLRTEHADRRLAHRHDRTHVEAQHRVELVLGPLGERLATEHVAGVVDQHVDPAKVRAHGLHQPPRLARLRDVGRLTTTSGDLQTISQWHWTNQSVPDRPPPEAAR